MFKLKDQNGRFSIKYVYLLQSKFLSENRVDLGRCDEGEKWKPLLRCVHQCLRQTFNKHQILVYYCFFSFETAEY